ncbi:pyridoxal phosphate-dependent aminotransferase [Algirhabdus cladophorae]|uniref:pyridoxal phosphate-dependent aminotransferase n=1 Tax=Algirhabdus cladophorae TaxID=3377108 RepID=UPI003B8476F7
MNLSHRITHITPGGSDGWEVFYKSRQMIADGVDVVELTIGEHDIRTDPIILDAMHAAAKGGHTGYAMVPGIVALRDKVAARLQAQSGIPTTRDNILITPGGQAALFAAHLACCNEGDVALICDPYYATYPGTVRGIGATPRPVICTPENNFQPQKADILAASEGATSILINTPNNPTGVVYDAATVRGIAEAATHADLWVISDEVYDSQVWKGAHISPRSLPDMADRTLIVGSMSKSHAMTGSRVGWVAGPVQAIEHLTNLATHTTYGVAGYIQDAALFALNQGPAFEAEIGAPFKRRRALAKSVINGQNVVKMINSDGAMYLMLDIRATGLSATDFAYGLLHAHHIAVMPGDSFGQAAAGHIRVAMTIEDTKFTQALETLCTFAANQIP